MLRFFRQAREVIQILSGKEDTALREKTAKLQRQLLLLRENRALKEKALEAQAIEDVRRVVQQLQDLNNDLNTAEAAIEAHANKVADEAKEMLDADLQAEASSLLASLAKATSLSHQLPELGSIGSNSRSEASSNAGTSSSTSTSASASTFTSSGTSTGTGGSTMASNGSSGGGSGGSGGSRAAEGGSPLLPDARPR